MRYPKTHGASAQALGYLKKGKSHLGRVCTGGPDSQLQCDVCFTNSHRQRVDDFVHSHRKGGGLTCDEGLITQTDRLQFRLTSI